VTEPEAESKLASWKAPQISVEVEYSLTVLSEIAAAARDALLEAPKGDLEIGGVLFGEHEAGSIRILTWRPIDCEHTEGPSLRLLARDRVELACLLELARRTEDLKDLQPVGWFVSHPRAGVRLSPSDLEIFNGFFPYPWQVTLALQPVAEGRARAGFFVREAGGSLKSDSSYREFEIEPLALPAPAETVPIFSWAGTSQRFEPPAERKPSGIAASQEPPAFRQVPDIKMPDVAADSQPQGSRKRVRWLWAIAILLIAGIGGFVLKERSSPRFEPFRLRVSDARQTMQVEWDRNSPLMQAARAAVLDIRDGGKSTRFALSPDEIRAGTMSYARQSGDVDLVMTVYPPTGPAVQGSGRLIATPDTPANKPGDTPPPSAAASDTTELRAERDALRVQVTRLEETVRKEAAEKNRLQDLVRILENRLNAGPNSNPGSETKQDK
jgi:proteasome lid subunit RPN8/RPN11